MPFGQKTVFGQELEGGPCSGPYLVVLVKTAFILRYVEARNEAKCRTSRYCRRADARLRKIFKNLRKICTFKCK